MKARNKVWMIEGRERGKRDWWPTGRDWYFSRDSGRAAVKKWNAINTTHVYRVTRYDSTKGK